MTAPAGEPTPGAPTPPTPAPPATPPAPGQDPNTPVDVDSLPPNVQKLIRDLRGENGNTRTRATAAEQAAQQSQGQLAGVLKALGLNPDGSPIDDPATAAAQYAQRAEAAENAAWKAGVELQVFRLAGQLGADGAALLDSLAFIDTLDDIAEDDPTTPAFRTALEAKIRAAMESNTRFKTQPAGPARVGADLTGGTGSGRTRPKSLGAALSGHYGQ